MATGTVKWFSSEKGYGFISQEGGPDVFVHYKAIQGQGYRTLEENEPVEFDVQESPKGLQAVNVVRMTIRAGESGLADSADFARRHGAVPVRSRLSTVQRPRVRAPICGRGYRVASWAVRPAGGRPGRWPWLGCRSCGGATRTRVGRRRTGGHDVKVGVRDALAYHFVESEEGPFRAQGGPLGGGDPAARYKHGTEENRASRRGCRSAHAAQLGCGRRRRGGSPRMR